MKKMKSEMHISVVICCYNSATRIKPTLEHIACQKLSGLTCEVILVNNNCTDNTTAVALSVWEECGNPFTLHIVEEKQAGLSFARTAGVSAAQGEIIIFCDDDNWLEEKYALTAYTILKKDNSIGICGGRSMAASDGELPFWFATYQESYAVGVQNLYSDFLDKRGYIWGAGMAFRRQDWLLFISAGFKSLLSDRKGSSLSSGGDSELCTWFLFVGKRLYYSEELIFTHFIEKNRLTKEYYTRLIEGISESVKVLRLYSIFKEHFLQGRKPGLWKNIGLVLGFLRKTNTPEQNGILECYNPTNKRFNIEIKQLKEAYKKYHLLKQ